MLSERFLCLCFGSFLKSENWGLPPVMWHCQCLFDAFSPTLLYMSLKDTVLVVWSLFHCYIFLVNCSFISIWSITISFLRFHSSCQFIWYHYWLLCPHTQLFFFFFLVSICLVHIFQPFISNFLVFSEFHVECIIAFLYYLSVCQLADKF